MIPTKPYNHPGSPMHGWPTARRYDIFAFGLIEAFCEHGVGHPIPESVEIKILKTGDSSWGTHGCDGCCDPPMTPSPIGNDGTSHPGNAKRLEEVPNAV